jgi:TIR domain
MARVWDVFISYAAEDRDTVARPLTEMLTGYGLAVWFDESALAPGDSLSEQIDRGLALSRFAVVVLSDAFFRKNWPRRELRGLTTREVVHGERTLLPLWHGITVADVARVSPPLADLTALPTSLGLPFVAERLLRVIRPGCSTPAVALTSLGEQPRSGYLSPIFPNDFRALQEAFDQDVDDGNASVLCHVDMQIWTRSRLVPRLPSAEVEAFQNAVANTVRSTAAPSTYCIQFASDELGLLLPSNVNHYDAHGQLETVRAAVEAILPQEVNVYVEMMSRCWGSAPSFADAMRELLWMKAEKDKDHEFRYRGEDARDDLRFASLSHSFTA